MAEKRLVFYPGHQGQTTRVHFGRSPRAMLFSADQIRAVPAEEASSLISPSGGFYEVLRPAEVAERYGIDPPAATARYEDEPVVVLDPPMRAQLLAAHRSAAADPKTKVPTTRRASEPAGPETQGGGKKRRSEPREGDKS